MTRKERKELATRRNALVREIMNLRMDYSNVYPEDIPEDVIAEMNAIRKELNVVREALLAPIAA